MSAARAERTALARAEAMGSTAAAEFMKAFRDVVSAHRAGRDLDDVWQAAHLNRHTTPATLAGLVEGMAATRGYLTPARLRATRLKATCYTRKEHTA
jgi:hypothetical protein